MFRLSAVMVIAAVAMSAADQIAPPILQIVREKLHAGVKAEYGRIEEELLYACRTLRAPNRYLALVDADEVWWLNMYGSQAEVDRVAAGYAANTALMAKLQELG